MDILPFLGGAVVLGIALVIIGVWAGGVNTTDGDIADDFERMGSTQLWLGSWDFENEARVFAVSIQDAD